MIKLGTVFNPISYDEKYGTLSALGFDQFKKNKTSKLGNNKEMISDSLFKAIINMNPDSNSFMVFYK